MGKTRDEYHLIHHDRHLNNEENILKENNEELQIVVNEEDMATITSLNSEQKHAYDKILQKVFNQEPVAFFVDGPSGSGKTYLYQAILATLM